MVAIPADLRQVKAVWMLVNDLLELYRCDRSTSSLDLPLLLAAFTTNNFAGPENEEDRLWQTTTMWLLDVFNQTTPACTASYLRYRVRTNEQRCCEPTKPPILNLKHGTTTVVSAELHYFPTTSHASSSSHSRQLSPSLCR